MSVSSLSVRDSQRPKQLAAMFLVGALLVGGALGFTADRVVGDRLLPRAEAATPPAARNALDEFSAEIGLTAAQRAGIDSIMDERHRIIDSIMTPVRPQINAARESARRQIRARLTPEQERRFDAYVQRQETASAKK
jgi:Spy/CpxP family protein refolding chaperone